MLLFAPNIEDGLSQAKRVAPKYRPAWLGKSARERAALAWYFLPHASKKAELAPTRPRVVKWYCPFADQRVFPSGHRYCINVYSGCSHGCVYCYAAGYASTDARPKAKFAKLLEKDLADLEAFDLPPGPVHLSNSTDAFQPMEAQQGHTRLALDRIIAHRRRFTTVTILTKNPMLAAREDYLDRLAALARPQASPANNEGMAAPPRPGLSVETSLAFWRDQTRAAYDPVAPSVASRIEGIRRLRNAGIPVVLRLAPLYPLTGLTGGPQSFRDIASLVGLARDLGLARIVYTPAKIVRPQTGPMHPLMRSMLTACRSLAGSAGLEFHGGSWRLPAPMARSTVVEPLLSLCHRYGVEARFCKDHILATR